jgi:hypothetical protein
MSRYRHFDDKARANALTALCAAQHVSSPKKQLSV